MERAPGSVEQRHLVTAFSPTLLSEASAEGTEELAWSTRLVEMLIRCPPPEASIALTASREISKNPRRFTSATSAKSASV